MCTRCALELASDDEMIVAGQWEREPHVPWDAMAVAKAVDDTLAAIVEETEGTARGKLVVYADTGKPWITLPIKAVPEGGASPLDGTATSQLVQNQRHLEGVLVSTLKKDQQLFEKAMEMLTTANNLNIARDNRSSVVEQELARLRDENAALKAENMTAEQVTEQAVQAAEEAAAAAEASKQASTTDGKMTEIFMKALQAPAPENGPSKPRKKRPDAEA